MSRWQRYWFADGGRLAAAILRIAIAVAVAWSLRRLWALPDLAAPAGIYRAVGPWMLLGGLRPPALVVDGLWLLAWAATAAMLVGWRARTATAVSFGAALSLAALSFSGSATWSHQYNVVFLAQLALLGARCGDALSVDAWLRHRRGLPPLDAPRGYQWSVRLVQLAVALMFVGACFHKLAHGRFTLDWALSDSLRHHLLIKYDFADLPRPALVDWLLADAWRYRTAAVLNLCSQLAPLAAVIFVRRPLIRAAAGAVFVVEVLGLGVVVSLWNLHWLPLVAAFIDWDRLLRAPPPPAADASWRPPRAARAFVLGFVIYDVLTAFVPVVDQKLNTYPFSGFPMFATVRAARPYDQHLPYGVPGDRYEVTAAQPIDARVQRWFDHHNRNLHLLRDPRQLRARLAAILARARTRYPELGITRIRHWTTLFEAPAYPAPARLVATRLGITGELDVDGTFRSHLGAPLPTLTAAGARLVHFDDDRSTELPLAAGEVVAADPTYVVAVWPDGTRWIASWRRSWRW